MAHILNQGLDIPGVTQDVAQPFANLGVVPDVGLDHMHGLVQDVVDGQRYGPVDRLDALVNRVDILCRQQLQGIQRGRDVAGENLHEQHVFLAEGPRLRTFHVERPDDLVMPQQGHGQ